MKLTMLVVAGLSVFTLLVLWMMTFIQYRIGSTHLKILWLGVPLRRINLADIKRISKRRPTSPAEYWYNTIHPSHKTLTIQRRSGLRKNVVITPRNRYIFLSELQQAIQRINPDTKLEEIIEPTPEEIEP